MRTRTWIWLAPLVLALAACGQEPRSEAEQYAELTSGFKYRTYSKLSEATVPIIVTEYNRRGRAQMGQVAPDAQWRELGEDEAHLALSLLWLLAAKPDFGIAEANISLSRVQREEDRYTSASLLGLGMYQKSWHGLALETTQGARAALSDQELADGLYTRQVLNYLIFGLLAAYQKDFKTATVCFQALGSITGVTWLSEAAEAAFLMQDGKIQEGLIKFKALSQNATLPESERIYLQGVVAELEAQVGKVDSPLFWPRLLGRVVLDRILATDTGPLKELFGKLDEFRRTAE